MAALGGDLRSEISSLSREMSAQSRTYMFSTVGAIVAVAGLVVGFT